MNKTIESAVDVEVHDDDIITLGVASIETKGGPLNGEPMGGEIPGGISEE